MTQPAPRRSRRRVNPTTAAFLIGLPLGAAALGAMLLGPGRMTPFHRYFTHPVEWAEVILFCCAVVALAVKFWQARLEQTACQVDLLPRWDGKPVPVAEAPGLLALIRRAGRALDTTVGRRLEAALEFLGQRQSAAQFDDQLRYLADGDAVAQENSYGFIRFVTWAIPILGFLGTVLGITEAVAGVNPETLQDSVSQVTDGLASAFDTTALALTLTMVAMFVSFLVERQEQSLLEQVDAVADRELAHRFLREGTAEGPFAEVVRQQTSALVQSVELLVRRQAELWAEAMREPQRRAEEGFAATLRAALESTLEAHATRLAGMDRQSTEGTARLLDQLVAVAQAVREAGAQQQAGLLQVADRVGGQAEILGRLQEDATNLVHLQAVLHQNLSALAGASAFEQAVHTLSAAVHLLTAKAQGTAAPAAPRIARAA